FRQRVRIAAETGFTGIGLRISDLHQSREENLTLPDMRRILDDYGIVVAEIDSLTQWMPHHKHQPGGLDEQELLQAIDVLGVRGVNVAELAAVGADIQAYAHKFSQLCDRAANCGALVHLEALPWSALPDLTTVAEIVR